ncbi:MAG: hypothetical protein ACKVS6_08145 [Planctomycetota bacterium]
MTLANAGRLLVLVFLLHFGAMGNQSDKRQLDEVAVTTKKSRENPEGEKIIFEGIVIEESLTRVVIQDGEVKHIFQHEDVRNINYHVDASLVVSAKKELAYGWPSRRNAIKRLQSWRPSRSVLEPMKFYHLGCAFFESGEFEDAEKQWMIVFKEYGDSYYVWDSLRMLMHVTVRLGKSAAALEAFENAIKLSRDLGQPEREKAYREYWNSGVPPPPPPGSDGSDGSFPWNRKGPRRGWAYDQINIIIRPGNGATANSEAAVERGLHWLARHQAADGSWPVEGSITKCITTEPCDRLGNANFRIALTALSVLAFMEAGFNTQSLNKLVGVQSKNTVYVGNIIKRGLLWLHASSILNTPDATDDAWGMNQSIATLVIVKAFGSTRAPQWKKVAQSLIENLLVNKCPAGGWGRTPKATEMDITVTTWAVQALLAAERAGMVVGSGWKNEMIRLYESQFDSSTETPPIFNFLPSLIIAPFQAKYMNLAIISNKEKTDPRLHHQIKLCSAALPTINMELSGLELNYWHDASLALYQLDGPNSVKLQNGKAWNRWNEAMKTALLDTQIQNRESCADGSWNCNVNDGFESGRIFATAIATLTLESYYRYSRLSKNPEPASRPPLRQTDSQPAKK